MDYAERGISEFPEFEGNYLVVGKMRYDRWKEDALPKDGLTAVQNFERAHELNRENYKTLLALGQIYLIVGAKAWAEERLKSILFLAPDDQRVARERNGDAKLVRVPAVGCGELEQLVAGSHVVEIRRSRTRARIGVGLGSYDGDVHAFPPPEPILAARRRGYDILGAVTGKARSAPSRRA